MNRRWGPKERQLGDRRRAPPPGPVGRQWGRLSVCKRELDDKIGGCAFGVGAGGLLWEGRGWRG